MEEATQSAAGLLHFGYAPRLALRQAQGKLGGRLSAGLGHASTDTTRVYAELDVEHLRRAHRKAFGG